MIEQEEPMEHNPLIVETWDALVRNNFKPLSLVSFNGKSDPRGHIIVTNTLITIIEVDYSLKCK